MIPQLVCTNQPSWLVWKQTETTSSAELAGLYSHQLKRFAQGTFGVGSKPNSVGVIKHQSNASCCGNKQAPLHKENGALYFRSTEQCNMTRRTSVALLKLS